MFTQIILNAKYYCSTLSLLFLLHLCLYHLNLLLQIIADDFVLAFTVDFHIDIEIITILVAVSILEGISALPPPPPSIFLLSEDFILFILKTFPLL